MSAGRRDRDKKVFSFLRSRPRQNEGQAGFTLLEVLIVAFILLVVLAGLFMTLSVGEFSSAISSAKVDLQANVRRAMDWIIKDVRQTNYVQINNNNASVAHIKFKTFTGINNITGSYLESPNYIEYDYDSSNARLLRNEIDDGGATLASWVFNNITQAYFDIGNLSKGKIVVLISGQCQVRSSLNLTFSLTEEVKLRNE